MEESKIKPWILSETMLSGIYVDYQKLPDEGTHWIMMINVVLIFILVVL
jgi:hypothetical protein